LCVRGQKTNGELGRTRARAAGASAGASAGAGAVVVVVFVVVVVVVVLVLVAVAVVLVERQVVPKCCMSFCIEEFAKIYLRLFTMKMCFVRLVWYRMARSRLSIEGPSIQWTQTNHQHAHSNIHFATSNVQHASDRRDSWGGACGAHRVDGQLATFPRFINQICEPDFAPNDCTLQRLHR
jgi:hypothetical protein